MKRTMADAIAIIRTVEWSGVTYGPQDRMGGDSPAFAACPICHGQKPTQMLYGRPVPANSYCGYVGHKDDCPIKAFLEE
jgi:hypothetical protein